jgi:hypothetical protein
MLTRAEGRRQRKEIERQIAADLKQKARATLRELGVAVREAKKSKAARVREARAACRQHRCLVKRRSIARRKRLLLELRDVTAQERRAARERCDVGRKRARESVETEIAKRRHELHHERAFQADMKRIEANNRSRRMQIHRASRGERRQESESEVLANIPAELAPLWERVKRGIKGSTKRSRTEAFLEYAEGHPHEIIEAQEGGIDATIRELERRQNEVERFARKPRYTPADLAAVPF